MSDILPFYQNDKNYENNIRNKIKINQAEKF